MSAQFFTLSQVTQSIEKTISSRYGTAVWIKAEMNKLNWYPHSGHAYPDLLEKKGGKVVAQLRGIIWKGNYDRIQANFKAELGAPLKEGVEILFLASITYNGIHGLSLMIQDIDVNFLLGSLERERQNTILKLQKEQLFDLNRSLKLPTIPQRIAVISVETSKGFADFKNALMQKEDQFKFYYQLFPAILQGERAITSIRFQLEKIRKALVHFDVVVITRGGGDEIGLSAFNDYDLAKDVATFPIPVLTGIGHATNLSVVDMVAYYHAITPTQIAQFLINQFENAWNNLQSLSRRVLQSTQCILTQEERRILLQQKYLQWSSQKYLIKWEHELLQINFQLNQLPIQSLNAWRIVFKQLSEQLDSSIQSFLSEQKEELELHEEKWEHLTTERLKSHKKDLSHLIQRADWMNPERILKRGYALIAQNEKIITESSLLKDGEFIIKFYDQDIKVEPAKIIKHE